MEADTNTAAFRPMTRTTPMPPPNSRPLPSGDGRGSAGGAAPAQAQQRSRAPQAVPGGEWGALIAAIAAGDADAFGEFYEAWFDRALALAASLTRRDESFCLDVVQDAMVRAVRSLRPSLGITSTEDVDRWMTRVVHTTALDRLRRDARRRERERRRERDRARPPDAGAEARERIEWVRLRLAELDPVDWELIRARFGDGRTIEGSAGRSGVSSGAAAGRLARAIRRLRFLGRDL